MLTLLASSARRKLTDMAGISITINCKCRGELFCFYFEIDLIYKRGPEKRDVSLARQEGLDTGGCVLTALFSPT